MSVDSNTVSFFDDLDVDDGFDPLEDFRSDHDADDEEDDVVEIIGNSSALTERTVDVLTNVDVRTDAEKIADLFKAMAPRRRVLLGILSFCREIQSVAAVETKVEELQKNDCSVYTAANYCNLFEKAGALSRIVEDGTMYDDVEIAPIVVEENGVEYIRPSTPPKAFLLTTEEGCKFLDADNPAERLIDIFSNESHYHPIYKCILLLCSEEGGKTTEELSKVIDDDPIIQNPRLYVQRFIDRLEKCDALVWEKTWKTTNVGQIGLVELGVDEYEGAVANA